MSRWCSVAILAVILSLSTACASTNTAPQIPGAGFAPTSPGPSGVYVALGASDTVGIGSDDPLRESWPHDFYVTTVNRGTGYYNLGISGFTTADVNRSELRRALSLHPTIVTVFVGVNDIIQGVSTRDFAAEFDNLMQQLSASGSVVLVADIPVLHSLPAVQACLTGQVSSPSVICPSGQAQLADITTYAELDARVAAYNAIIKREVAAARATLVDLAALGDYVKAQPQLVSDDGFHPSDAGHRQIAQRFASAYAARIAGH